MKNILASGCLFALPEIGSSQIPRVELTSYYTRSLLAGSYERNGTNWSYDEYFELDYRTNAIYEHYEGNYPDPNVRGGWHTDTWPGLGMPGWREWYTEPSPSHPWPTEYSGPIDLSTPMARCSCTMGA
jgi:hypothetical protein